MDYIYDIAYIYDKCFDGTLSAVDNMYSVIVHVEDDNSYCFSTQSVYGTNVDN
jgi:hypothetical protein